MIAWVDTETTGLDPHAQHAALLEVGIIITDNELEVVDACSTAIWAAQADTDAMDQFVKEMHKTSGLLADVLAKEGSRNLFVRDAEERFIRFVESIDKEPMVMAGSTIRFDRAWLERFMPELHSKFHYRSIDISGIREAAHRWWPELDDSVLPQQKAHRVIPDIYDSLALARFYKNNLTPLTKENTSW